MADGYNIGIARQPIDLVSGGQNFLQAAVEQKLADIEQNRLQVEDADKARLKAMSLKTMQGLTRGIQGKYSKEIEDYKKKITDKFVANKGKLSDPEKLEIEQGFDDITNRQMADIQALKFRDEARKITNDPNFAYGFDVKPALDELAAWDRAMERGEYLGDPRANILKHRVQPSVGDYVSKKFDAEIGRLDTEAFGDFKGNIFTSTTVQNKEEVERLRDNIMNDPNVKSKFTASDGRVFEDKKKETQQLVEDYINKKITETKPYRQATGGSGGYTPYVNMEKEDEIVDADKGDIKTGGRGNISTTDVTSFVWTDKDGNSKKVASEKVTYLPVAKSADIYNKKRRSVGSRYGQKGELLKPSSEYLVIGDDELDKFDRSDYDFVPFAKLAVPKDKGIDFTSYESLVNSGAKVNTEFVPLKDVSTNLYGRMGSKRDGYINQIDRAGKELNKKDSNKEPTKNEVERKTADGRIAIFDADTKKFIRYK